LTLVYVTLTLNFTLAFTLTSWLASKVTSVAPALTLVFTFMSYPPYELGTFLGPVTGLRPLGSRVAIGVAL
jgi:hypothetical protein